MCWHEWNMESSWYRLEFQLAQTVWLVLWEMRNSHAHEGCMAHWKCFQDIVAYGPLTTAFAMILLSVHSLGMSWVLGQRLLRQVLWSKVISIHQSPHLFSYLWIYLHTFFIPPHKTPVYSFISFFRGLYIYSKNHKPQKKVAFFSWVQGKRPLTFSR